MFQTVQANMSKLSMNDHDILPKLTNAQEAKDFIDGVDNKLRQEMLQRVYDMLIINLGQLSDRYKTLHVGEFDMYLYIIMMDKLFENTILLEDYLSGHFTNRNEL